MDRKIKKDKDENPRERVNQFIIECMFSKYFEEEGEPARGQEAAPTEEKVAVRGLGSPAGTGSYGLKSDETSDRIFKKIDGSAGGFFGTAEREGPAVCKGAFY